jgi:hypothetical protein
MRYRLIGLVKRYLVDSAALFMAERLGLGSVWLDMCKRSILKTKVEYNRKH